MIKPEVTETLRMIFRALPDGLRLREPPTAKVDEKVLRQVFSSVEFLKNEKSDNPDFRPSSPEPKK